MCRTHHIYEVVDLACKFEYSYVSLVSEFLSCCYYNKWSETWWRKAMWVYYLVLENRSRQGCAPRGGSRVQSVLCFLQLLQPGHLGAWTRVLVLLWTGSVGLLLSSSLSPASIFHLSGPLGDNGPRRSSRKMSPPQSLQIVNLSSFHNPNIPLSCHLTHPEAPGIKMWLSLEGHCCSNHSLHLCSCLSSYSC